MQNNFECIVKLIVALTFLMCAVCSHYQYSFLMFYIVLLFSFFLFYFLNEKQQKKKKKERKKIKKVNHELNFLFGTFLVQLFFPLD